MRRSEGNGRPVYCGSIVVCRVEVFRTRTAPGSEHSRTSRKRPTKDSTKISVTLCGQSENRFRFKSRRIKMSRLIRYTYTVSEQSSYELALI